MAFKKKSTTLNVHVRLLASQTWFAYRSADRLYIHRLDWYNMSGWPLTQLHAISWTKISSVCTVVCTVFKASLDSEQRRMQQK